MDIDDSPQDLQFRAEVRAWISEAFDDELRAMMAQSKNGHLDKAAQVRWQKALHARGWAAPNWPQAHGGPGWTPTQRHLFQSELAAAGCPAVSPMGLKMVAPVIMKYGSPGATGPLSAAHPGVRRLVVPGLPEPNSAPTWPLQMRATRGVDANGEHYILNGSKIWTTHAQWADWMFVWCGPRVRAGRRRALRSCCSTCARRVSPYRRCLRSDGPMEGQQEVNQVFDDVRVPAAQRIGEEGMGWTIAKYLLEFERGRQLRADAAPGNWTRWLPFAAQPGEDGTGRLIDDPIFRQRLGAMYVRVAATEAAELRLFSGVARVRRSARRRA
jgi:acyl-CoA dehydrogenase